MTDTKSRGERRTADSASSEAWDAVGGVVGRGSIARCRTTWSVVVIHCQSTPPHNLRQSGKLTIADDRSLLAYVPPKMSAGNHPPSRERLAKAGIARLLRRGSQ